MVDDPDRLPPWMTWQQGRSPTPTLLLPPSRKHRDCV